MRRRVLKTRNRRKKTKIFTGFLAQEHAYALKNSFAVPIFDAYQNISKFFQNSKFSYNLGNKSEPNQFGVAGSAKFELG